MTIPRLPDAELEIMKTVWKNDETETTSAYILEKLEGKKDWAVTTVLSFLARLAERGFLSVRRSGKTNYYTPLIDEKTYLERESKSFLERLHGNSLKSLVTSLYSDDAISLEDLEELQSFINEKAGERS